MPDLTDEPLQTETETLPRVHPRRIRLRYARQGPVRFLSHLDLVRAIERAVRRSALPAAYTEGFHPRLRLSFASALPVGAESVAEWMDLDLDSSAPTSAVEVQAALNRTLPPGLAILEAREVGFPCRSLGGIIALGIWRLEGPALTAADARQRIQALPAEGPWQIIRKSQRRDVHALVESLTVHEDPLWLEARVRILQNGSVKPDELLTLLGYPLDVRQAFRACRQALLAPGSKGWTEPWGETVM